MRRSMEMLTAATAAVTLPFALSACGDDGGRDFVLEEPSQVQDLEFIPEHTVEVEGDCLYSDKGICYIYEYDDVVVPAEWVMTVRQCPSGPRPESNEEVAECLVKDLSIDQDEFNELDERDIVIVDDDGDVNRIPQKSELW